MIIYAPRLIESAEQAEALPSGSIVLDHESKWTYTDYFIAARPPLSGLQDDLDHGAHVVALVPIEAEEETVVDTADLDLDPENEYWSEDPALLDAARDAPKRTRFVTPWGEPE